ncbi:hypothetical protein [Streptomyces inusitatus]|uniref:hypothetical protein n=1 Tax=Streptomyces inusitatus TaxID=68221 RepID=UPI00167EFCC4|nr:hypothetical protein [Streptomyces inusitatus]
MSRAVGRRTALRYLAVGVGASLLTACGGGGGGGGGDASPTPTESVAGQALAAFLRGGWKVAVGDPGEETRTFSATVEGTSWTLDFGEHGTLAGTWSLQGGRLNLHHPESLNPGGSQEMTDSSAENLPATVDGSVALSLPWKPPPGSFDTGDQRLDVKYDKKSGTLRIVHVDGASKTHLVCTRA